MEVYRIRKNNVSFLMLLFLLSLHIVFQLYEIRQLLADYVVYKAELDHNVVKLKIFQKIFKLKDTSPKKGLIKYEEQCHRYPNDFVKEIVESNKTMEQISVEYRSLRVEKDGVFGLNNGEYENK